MVSLSELNLSHNYLRALTVDLVAGLSSVESLDLSDNDISLVEHGAMDNLHRLTYFSLAGELVN